jgi:uncharacterized protein (TIGR03067 family)
MRTFVAAAAFVALVLPIASADDAAAKKLNGSYEVLSITVSGKLDNEKKDRIKEFTIKDGTITVKEAGEKVERARFTVDPTKKPAHFDFTPRKEPTIMAIYDAKETDKGLELTLALPGDANRPRPSGFKGEGAHDIVVKLLRKK